MNTKLLLSVLPLLPFVAAKVGGHCHNEYGYGSFSWSGICVKTSDCDKYGGTYISGLCPDDPANVKCCYVNTCDSSHPEGYSYCEWTNHACPLGDPGSGKWKSSV